MIDDKLEIFWVGSTVVTIKKGFVRLSVHFLVAVGYLTTDFIETIIDMIPYVVGSADAPTVFHRKVEEADVIAFSWCERIGTDRDVDNIRISYLIKGKSFVC